MINIVHNLAKSNADIYIACRTGSALSQYCREQQWSFIELPFRNSFDIESIWKLRNFCRKHSIDIIHIHSGKSHSIAVLSILIGNNADLVLSRRVFFPIKKNWFTKWKYNHSSVRKIICISKAVQDEVLNVVSNPALCTVIYSGVDINRFKSSVSFLKENYALDADSILVGVTAAIEPAKDLQVFVDTAALVSHRIPKTFFFIIGDGPERNTIQEYINQKELQNKVFITGFLRNIEEVLPELDIFLMTSQTEGLGTSILDAFACRIPVVATAAGGIPEMVKHNETGLLAPVKDAQQLAHHVLDYIHSSTLREKVSGNAYQLLKKEFTSSVMAKKTLEVYREILSKSST